jgi:hypothetical protein
MKGSPFPVILGLDFMRQYEMSVDVGARTFGFRLAPDCKGEFCLGEVDASMEAYLQLLQVIGNVEESKSENVVADPLSRTFEGGCGETPEVKCMTLLKSLPLVYSS